jgi:aryl-alcohol dehydrogenase-like predicted oxidoreductase
MEYRLLGRTGITVSAVCLGTMMFGEWGNPDPENGIGIIHRALDAGINFIDTADVYSAGESERIVGRAIAGRRDEIVLATKFHLPSSPDGGTDPNRGGSSRRWIIQAAEESLRRLGTDYIDLYQLHGFDALTPVEETLDTLNTLIRAGKLRYIGCSNFSGWHLMKSLAVSDRYGLARYVANQTYYSLIGRDYEWELMPLGLDQHVGAVVWSPLGWGRLTGKVRRGLPLPATSRLNSKASNDAGPQVADEFVYQVVDALDVIAKETGKSVAQIALNWLLQRPTVSTVIIGARNEEQLRQNIAAVGWKLSPEHIAKLDAASAKPAAYPYWHQHGFTERNPLPTSGK